jgi:hypothetical protein
MGGHYIFEWLQVYVESESEKIIILDKSLGQVSKVPKECNYPFNYKYNSCFSSMTKKSSPLITIRHHCLLGSCVQCDISHNFINYLQSEGIVHLGSLISYLIWIVAWFKKIHSITLIPPFFVDRYFRLAINVLLN